MNPKFEEWFEEMVNEFEIDEVGQSLIRDAYKLGLNRGFASVMDTKVAEEVCMELQILNKDDE